MDTGAARPARAGLRPRRRGASSSTASLPRRWRLPAGAGGGALFERAPRRCRPRPCARPARCPRPTSWPPACAAACASRLPLYDTLRLADLGGDPVVAGTPYFTPARSPARCARTSLRQGLPDRRAGPQLTDINKAQMGLAALVDHETCLNFLGLRCDVCYRVCPVIDKAITLETQHNPRSDRHAMLLPTVHSDACTGCGKCEKSCVLPGRRSGLPRKLAQGALPAHYRKGWGKGPPRRLADRRAGRAAGARLEGPPPAAGHRDRGGRRPAPPHRAGRRPSAAPRRRPPGINSNWKPVSHGSTISPVETLKASRAASWLAQPLAAAAPGEPAARPAGLPPARGSGCGSPRATCLVPHPGRAALTDPLLVLQTLATGHLPYSSALIGAAIVLVFTCWSAGGCSAAGCAR